MFADYMKEKMGILALAAIFTGCVTQSPRVQLMHQVLSKCSKIDLVTSRATSKEEAVVALKEIVLEQGGNALVLLPDSTSEITLRHTIANATQTIAVLAHAYSWPST